MCFNEYKRLAFDHFACLIPFLLFQTPGSSTFLPVLVWIHGGTFVMGTGAFQESSPKYFMDSEVVVVTINYRLGPFGE